VWECTCNVLGDWKDRGFKLLPISINVSRVHLNNDAFLLYLDELTEKYGIEKKYLELEITESIEGEHISRMTGLAKEHGYTLLMDDFGSGYSSLNTLKSTKFDVLKIDREFLSSFLNDERGKKIISHTISMSKDVGLGLIAEGVETLEQAKFLESCGCDTAQGYYYAKPMPVQDAESYLEVIKTPKKKK
jgi:EAL domain-containing protein (putative c-di-GMP-specific phosphodiesterase class I)